MNLKKFILTVALGAFGAFSAFAQGFLHTVSQEYSARVGVVSALRSGQGMEPASLFGVDYARYNAFGLGVKVGAQYTQQMYQLHDLVEFPVSIVYKTAPNSTESRLRNAAYGAAFSAWYSRDFSSMLESFIMGLFSDVDVYAGVTPGMYGSAFSTTLDAGASINFRLWRLCLKLMPAFHCNVTNNYQYLIEYDGYDEPHTISGLMSVCAGLSYSF